MRRRTTIFTFMMNRFEGDSEISGILERSESITVMDLTKSHLMLANSVGG